MTTSQTLNRIANQKDNAVDVNGFVYYFEPLAGPDFVPTSAPCGSMEKIQVMRERMERGEPLYHPGDETEQDRVKSTSRSIKKGQIMKQYPKHNGTEEERGFTADEIRRNVHVLFIDVTCEECGKVQSVAMAGSIDNGKCIRCGGRTT